MYKAPVDRIAFTLKHVAGLREALRSLAADDVKVVTIASDILHVPRVAYIGIDNRAAGRLAGYVMSRFMGAGRAGKVALFAGSLSYRGREERENGLSALANRGAFAA